MELRPPRTADGTAFRAAHAVLAAEGFVFGLDACPTWGDYLASLDRLRPGTEVPDGLLPATFLVAEVAGEIVGRTSVRHRLNDYLLREGGHIGYGVLPAHRRRGYATEILWQSLVVARAAALLDRVTQPEPLRPVVTGRGRSVEACVRIVPAVGAVLLSSILAALMTAPPACARTDPEAGAPGGPRTDPRPRTAFADPEVAQLQRTAAGVQRELGDLAAKIHDADRELRTATDAATAARSAREQADQVVSAQQDDVDAYSAAVYATLAQPSEIRALMSGGPENFLDGSGLLDRLRADQDVRLAGAIRRQASAERAERTANGALADAADRRARLDDRTADASERADAVSAELSGMVADTDAAVVTAQRDQRQRNDRTAASWRSYLATLAKAGVVPPPAAALRDPAHLPARLSALAGKTGPQRGVAKLTRPSGAVLRVLPKETITAVSAAIDALGKPYVPARGGAGPAAYSCDGLVRSAFGRAGVRLPSGTAAQLATGAPVPLADAQPGDLVFLGPRRYGVQGVGIVLDGRTMLTADARLAGVVVTDLPGGDTVLGVTRPSLPAGRARAVPRAGRGELTWRCGGVELPARTPGEAAGAWGGYPNGFIPPAALCPIGVGGHVLRCDAAASFAALNRAYAATFGRPVCVTDSYRTFAEQVRLYGVKPALAAVPGTSNHGWALAVDLCGGIQSFASAQYAWMAANAPAFGWSNPPWAWRGQGREEPWHWEFTG